MARTKKSKLATRSSEVARIKIRSLKAARTHFKRVLTRVTPAILRATLRALKREEKILRKSGRRGITGGLKRIERSRKEVAETAAILVSLKRQVIPQIDQAINSLQGK